MKANNSVATIRKLQRQQTALAQFGAYAFREPELKPILTEAARLCAEGLNVPFCKVLRYRAEENDLIVEAGVGWKAHVIGLSIARADESSPVGEAFVTGKPVITRDLRKPHEFALPPIYPDHGIISTVNVLIQGTSNRPYGVLEADSPELRIFDKQDIDFLQGFANVLAEAVATAEKVAALRSIVVQKDALGRELQHRVRNNLQIVYRMLDREARQTTDADAKRGIQSVARRVIVLGNVYQHLLGVGLSHTIDFGEYLQSLCTTLADFYRAEHPEVRVSAQVSHPEVDIDTATALGVIVNELMTNSYEHAFSNRGKGTINVVLRHADETVTLIVGDDGPGFMQTEGKGHGLTLVRGLVRQVRGNVDVQSDKNGTIWTITVPTR